MRKLAFLGSILLTLNACSKKSTPPIQKTSPAFVIITGYSPNSTTDPVKRYSITAKNTGTETAYSMGAIFDCTGGDFTFACCHLSGGQTTTFYGLLDERIAGRIERVYAVWQK